MKKSFILLICSLLTANIFAQSITVSGKLVASIDNEGLPFVTVLVADEATPETVVQRFATDADGVFSVALNVGTYIFSFNFVGMAELNKTVEVSAAQNPLNLGEIALEEDATVLGEVSVVAQRQLVRVEIDRLSYSVQDDPEASTSNVLDMMRRVPLLTVDGEDNIQLRGSSSFRIHLNGRPSNMISNNPREVLRSMPASNILRIEVITDPGARYDAEGVDGIINIVTNRRVDDGYSGTVGARAGTLGDYGGNAFLNVKRGMFGFSGNISHFQNRSPENTTSAIREEFAPLPQNKSTQEGTNDWRFRGFFSSAMLTFEPDTLNLFSLSVNGFSGNHRTENRVDVLSEGVRNFNYTQISESRGEHGNMSFSADYQRGFRRNREELLTFSYRWQNNPGGSRSWFEISDAAGTLPPSVLHHRQRSVNDANGDEHTVQIDYVNPLSRRHVIEAGARIIFRHNYSESEHEFYDNGVWDVLPMRNNDLDHRQQITSGYASYTFRADRFSVRPGVRAEYTDQTIVFADNEPVNTHYFNLIPSLAVSYQIKPTTTLRFNYGLRVNRPGIWHLNPFVNDIDPMNISYGNPDLSSVIGHNFSLNFGHFAQRFNINATLSHNFSNNEILRYQFIDDDGVVHNTFGNIGRQRRTGLDLHGSWTPIQQLRINLNGGINYVDMRGEYESEGFNFEQHAYGFAGRVFTNITYSLPRNWRVGFNGGYFSPWIQLQTTSNANHFHSFNVMKSFLDRRLDVQLIVQNPFQRYTTWESKTVGEGFTQNFISKRQQRSAGISVSYRFGELRTSMRRVQRSITTDDVMQGEGGGQGGGQ